MLETPDTSRTLLCALESLKKVSRYQEVYVLKIDLRAHLRHVQGALFWELRRLWGHEFGT